MRSGSDVDFAQPAKSRDRHPGQARRGASPGSLVFMRSDLELQVAEVRQRTEPERVRPATLRSEPRGPKSPILPESRSDLADCERHRPPRTSRHSQRAAEHPSEDVLTRQTCSASPTTLVGSAEWTTHHRTGHQLRTGVESRRVSPMRRKRPRSARPADFLARPGLARVASRFLCPRPSKLASS